MTLYEQMKKDQRTLDRRNYLIKKNGSIGPQKRFLEFSPYNTMLNKQNGVCAICGKECKSGRKLAIDHNHKNGRVRGLLCQKCNMGLGCFDDTPELMLKAIEYINNNGHISRKLRIRTGGKMCA